MRTRRGLESDSRRNDGANDLASRLVRVLILSWEYPPIVEGGLARHVRKLSEQLVALGIEVHVVTRGGGRLSESEDRHGVAVHRVREPDFPKDDLDAFIAWVEHMNAEAGASWLRRLLDAYPATAWLNPEPERLWPYRQSVELIHQIVGGRMYPLTLDGLARAMQALSKKH